MLKPTPLRVPKLTPLTTQLLSKLSPIAVLFPPAPSISSTLPPLNAKVSALLPPTSFWNLLKVKEELLISPLLMPLIFQLLAVLSPVKVLFKPVGWS